MPSNANRQFLDFEKPIKDLIDEIEKLKHSSESKKIDYSATIADLEQKIQDKRKEITELVNLDYSAVRDDNRKVLGLSEGQKLMLRAGLRKLNILEEHFTEFTKDSSGKSNKYPKMLVVCEDTSVSPFVEGFLRSEGLSAEDVTRVDSNRSGEIPKAEWAVVKQKLFNVDKYAQPRVIVSVLMLREGFDVSNICVIVARILN